MKKNDSFTNSDIAAIDWAQEDRAKALFRLNQRKFASPAGATANSGWGRDLSGTDKRSVKAQLAGRGDLRSVWWNVFCATYLLFVPSATLERAMFRFHSTHHWFTLAWTGFILDVRQFQGRMAREGVAAALQGAITATSPHR